MIFKDFKSGRFYNEDCFDAMKEIPYGVIDMVLADLPYGTTDCDWDTIISFDQLWRNYWKICKPNAAIVLTATQPFATAVISSQIKNFKYDWIWDKVNRYGGFGNVSYMPLKRHENILIFVKSGKPTFNPQMKKGTPYKAQRSGKKPINFDNGATGGLQPINTVNEGTRNPVSIIDIKADVKSEMGLHPTQKPVALFEYLIKTYTNENEIVLDNTAGSGTTAIAAINTNRKWVCIEKDKDYYDKAIERIRQHSW